ncbi:uncharacterized protein LOC133174518 [Saccostrea echinata]|uniref:uncharacterized protein LOC133174518 n=1 Tax=Saccostrea echinata TaxID=191078 RepID=UPI002A7EFD98|nr:uncharacterized protein LOC133174518 [Saccostrea echinata]
MLHASAILTLLQIIHGYENIALYKPTHQSHVYISNTFEEQIFDSSNAVDGLKTNLSAFGGQCVISADKYFTATWWVNLTSIYSIHDIKIYYRTDNSQWGSPSISGLKKRFLGFYVYVSNTTNRFEGQLCFHDKNYSLTSISAVIDIPCPIHGQYVIYYNERPQIPQYPTQLSPYAHNELCEVEVNGCEEKGYYGPNCSLPCPGNCKHPYCHIETGACQECRTGYQGLQCELHIVGEQLERPTQRSQSLPASLQLFAALRFLASGTEQRVIGYTLGISKSSVCCDAGYMGVFCITECTYNMYGRNCSRRCGNCRNGGKCHHINGTCSNGCIQGYKGIFCSTG